MCCKLNDLCGCIFVFFNKISEVAVQFETLHIAQWYNRISVLCVF